MSYSTLSQIMLNMVKEQIDCINLYSSPSENKNMITLAFLDDQYIDFKIEVRKSNYVLTKTVFTNKLQKQSDFAIDIKKQSEVKTCFDNMYQVRDYIVNYTLTTNKIKGIPCRRI